MLVHGVDDRLAYVDALREFTLKDRAQWIRCPTWVLSSATEECRWIAIEKCRSMAVS
jgi:hypothetical protein